MTALEKAELFLELFPEWKMRHKQQKSISGFYCTVQVNCRKRKIVLTKEEKEFILLMDGENYMKSCKTFEKGHELEIVTDRDNCIIKFKDDGKDSTSLSLKGLNF